jgi:hypothetical protein
MDLSEVEDLSDWWPKRLVMACILPFQNNNNAEESKQKREWREHKNESYAMEGAR